MTRSASLTLPWKFAWSGIALFGAFMVVDWMLLALGDSCDRIFAKDRTGLAMGIALLGAAVGAALLPRLCHLSLAQRWQQPAYFVAILAVFGTLVLFGASSSLNAPLIGKPGFLGEDVACGL